MIAGIFAPEQVPRTACPACSTPFPHINALAAVLKEQAAATHSAADNRGCKEGRATLHVHPCAEPFTASMSAYDSEENAQGGGSKKGGGNQKKGGSAIADLLKPKQPYEKTEIIMHTLMLIENHRRKVGRCFPWVDIPGVGVQSAEDDVAL